MRLDIIRHGKTEANASHLYCGWTDLPLSGTGREEILTLRNKGIYKETACFLTSGSLRAAETLTLIYGHNIQRVFPDFKEYNFGRFEMKSYEALCGDMDYQAWIIDQTGEISCPGGENRNDFRSRVQTGFSRLLEVLEKEAIESACMVCHGGTIAEIMAYVRPEEKNFYEWQPKFGRGYSLVVDNHVLHTYKAI